jgi:hypothetical protein
VWSWRGRIIGIILGVALGVAVIVAFVFFLSEQTVDAPSLSGGRPNPAAKRRAPPPRPNHHQHHHRSAPPNKPVAPPPVATVRIIGGAPPPSGPAQLNYKVGEEIRLNVISDATLDVELTGYGLTRTVPADQPTEIDVHANRPGAFALIVATSHIDVARLTVTGG